MPTSTGEDYRRDGFATLAGVLDPDATCAALEHLARCRMQQRLPPDAEMVPVALSDAYAGELAEDERLVPIASALLGTPAVAFGITYFCKPARTGLAALWHQDGAPWTARLEGDPALTVWVALDDADGANGCLRVIPGSHRISAQPLRPNTVSPSLFGVEMDPGLVDEALAIDVALRSGDVSVHHPQLIHSSGANLSDHPRRAVALRYRGRRG